MAPLVSAVVMQLAGSSDATAADVVDDAALANSSSPSVNATVEHADNDVQISPAQLTLGFRTVMTWGLLGAGFLVAAWRAAERECRARVGHGLTGPEFSTTQIAASREAPTHQGMPTCERV